METNLNPSQITTSLPTKENTTECSNKQNLKMTPLEATLQLQNKNYQDQIQVLQEKINYYETDYFTKTTNLTNQIKNFGITEKKLKKEINDKNITISNYEKENKYLKSQICEMEKSVLYFKKEVKELYNSRQNNYQIPQKDSNNHEYIKKQCVNQINTIEYDSKIRELIGLLKQYSDEISKLKNENISLNQALSNYVHNPPTPRDNKESFIENELRTMNMHQNSISSCTCTCNNVSNENEMNKIIVDMSTIINNELLFITQWIDTYLGNNYDKHFEVPSLLGENNEGNYFNVNFDMLKSSLENSRNKINHELNYQEKSVQEMKSMLSQSEIKNASLKSELSELRRKLYLVNENELKVRDILDSNDKQIKIQNEKINTLDMTIEKMKKEYGEYLDNLYKIISDEINLVLHDNNFQAFHSNIICIGKDDCYSNKKSIELVLSSKFDKLIQFLNELKYDYIKTKNENFKFLTENINTNSSSSENLIFINNELTKANQRIGEQEELISKLQSENSLLKNQINFIEQNNLLKQKNQYDIKESCDILTYSLTNKEKELNETKSQLLILTEKNKMLEDKILKDSNIINEYKSKFDKALKIEIENEKIKKDYQRLLDENEVLKKTK